MITIKYVQNLNKAIAIFPYDPDSTLLVKSLGATAVYENKKFIRWELELSQELADRLHSMKDDKRILVDVSIYGAIEAHKDWKKINYEMSAAKESDLKINPHLDAHLKSYQRAAVEYMSRNPKGVLVGDQMGLGKTLEVLATLEYRDFFPSLIICPAVVKYNWAREIEKWLPGRTFSILNGPKRKEEPEDPDIYIINYDILQKHWDFLIHFPFLALVCDESHYLKNYQAKRTLLVQELAKQVKYKFLLSGTPVLNRPAELLPQLTILDIIKDFGGFWPFANKYCQAHKTRFGWDLTGAANLDELNVKLRELGYLRREKKEVLPELPEKTRIDLWVRIDNGPMYEQARKELIPYLEEHARLESEFLESISNLNESEKALKIGEYRMEKANKARRAEILVKMNILKQLCALGKIEAAKSWVLNYFENGGEKLVIFAWHTEVCKMMADMFKADLIIGETSAEDRDQAVQKFQNAPAARVLVCNIQAGGVGITLTAADTSLFLEMGWNPGTMEQAEDRIHRIGQVNAVSVYYMMGEGTIDRANWNLVWNEKAAVVNSVTDGFDMVRDYLMGKESR